MYLYEYVFIFVYTNTYKSMILYIGNYTNLPK